MESGRSGTGPAKYNDLAKETPEMTRDVAGKSSTIDFALDLKAGEIVQRPEPGAPRPR